MSVSVGVVSSPAAANSSTVQYRHKHCEVILFCSFFIQGTIIYMYTSTASCLSPSCATAVAVCTGSVARRTHSNHNDFGHDRRSGAEITSGKGGARVGQNGT